MPVPCNSSSSSSGAVPAVVGVVIGVVIIVVANLFGPVSAIVGIVIGVLILVVSIVVYVTGRRPWRRRRRDEVESILSMQPQPPTQLEGSSSRGDRSRGDVNIPSPYLGPRIFSYEELSIATKNFSQSEELGRGGFGKVYKGNLAEDGRLVAVKTCIHAENSKQDLREFREREFKAEVGIISNLRHRNLVRLIGWGNEKEGEYMLVYEFLSKGSLDNLLFKDAECGKLGWGRRYSIALGLTSALQYLHEECEHIIIHRDVKSSNVLLDESYTAKLGDFGLSRQMTQDITSHSTIVAGTRGYMAPEIAFGFGKATRETDVYAFGIVLLELVCGKPALDVNSMLVDWVWHLYGQGRLLGAVDTRLHGQLNSQEAKWMLVVGLACSHPDAKARPKIRQAMEALRGSPAALPSLPPSKPPFPHLASPKSWNTLQRTRVQTTLLITHSQHFD